MKRFPSWLFALPLIPLMLFGGCSAVSEPETVAPERSLPDHLVFGVPQETDLLLSRRGFSIGYSHKMRQAIWVGYILSAEDLTGAKVPRAGKFRVDPAVKFRPVTPEDYNCTGYDRGHLAPAADMVRSAETMNDSFFMTNISPQVPGCNRGVWKRLEKQVRQWAVREGKVCIVTGPIFGNGDGVMGSTDIAVPEAFYKVILDLTPPRKMIAFIIPNEPSRKRLDAFVVTVDTVEDLTGCDFFSELDDESEDRMEAESDISAWR